MRCHLYEVSHTDISILVAEAFRCSHLVFATTTYNMLLYPPMSELLHHLEFLHLCGRKYALIENGSWEPRAGKLMTACLTQMPGMEAVAPLLTLRSTLKDAQQEAIAEMAKAIVASL